MLHFVFMVQALLIIFEDLKLKFSLIFDVYFQTFDKKLPDFSWFVQWWRFPGDGHSRENCYAHTNGLPDRFKWYWSTKSKFAAKFKQKYKSRPVKPRFWLDHRVCHVNYCQINATKTKLIVNGILWFCFKKNCSKVVPAKSAKNRSGVDNPGLYDYRTKYLNCPIISS